MRTSARYERYMGGAGVSMKGGLGLLLAFAALVSGCATGHVSEMKRLQAQNAYERGLSQVGQGQSALALSSVQEAATLDPYSALYRDTLGLLLLGLVLIAEKRSEEAKAYFRRAQQLAPESPFGRAAMERLKALGNGG